jgi:hypothetical protein
VTLRPIQALSCLTREVKETVITKGGNIWKEMKIVSPSETSVIKDEVNF